MLAQIEDLKVVASKYTLLKDRQDQMMAELEAGTKATAENEVLRKKVEDYHTLQRKNRLLSDKVDGYLKAGIDLEEVKSYYHHGNIIREIHFRLNLRTIR